MVVVHYKCDRCGKDGQAREDVLPLGWRGIGSVWRTVWPRDHLVHQWHYCSEECSLPPRYAHTPWSMGVDGDRFLGRHGEHDLYFVRDADGTPRVVARSGEGPRFVDGWDSIAVGLCEAERRARALGLVEEGK